MANAETAKQCGCFDLSAPVLITGATGFIGRNLAARLQAMGCGCVLQYDISSPEGALEEYAAQAGFVFHLAGVNRPKDASEFYAGNSDLTARLLSLLEAQGRKTPVLVTSSTQAAGEGDYGKSKAMAEQAVFGYGQRTGAEVYVYRLPGVFGKWSRPNYNSVVATFCHNVASGLPLEVRDPAFALPLIYIDDVVDCFLQALQGKAEADPENPAYRLPKPVYTATLGGLAQLVNSFRESRESLMPPDMGDAFTRKLYATYLSYLPADGFAYPLKMNSDERGSFTEFLKSPERGQVSVNVAKPGVVKGNHWHNTKNEKFLVVSGEAAIRFRRVGDDEIIEYRVSGSQLRVVDIPTGYTHNIENVGAGDLVTVMWASEVFDPENPDTYYEKVQL